MKVRMLVQVSGTRDGADWPGPGELADVAAGDVDGLVANGIAERIGGGVESADVDTTPKRRTRK